MTRRETDLVLVDGGRPTWESIRRYILERDPVCAICGLAPSVEVDHIWPRYHGGDDMEANLQGVCGPCNKAKGNYVDHTRATARQLLTGMEAACKRINAARSEAASFGMSLTWCGDDDYRWTLSNGLTCMEHQAALILSARKIVGEKLLKRLDREQLEANRPAAELSEVSP